MNCERMIGPYKCCSVVQGDCLELMCDLPDSCVDAVISDPPFSSGARTDAGKSLRGGMVRGAKWSGNWFSHDNMATHGFMYLMRHVAIDLLRVARTEATLHMFIDWRMYPNLYAVLESAGWMIKNLVVWDKKHFGMGANYRNQHELIIYGEKGDSKFQTHSLGNVLSYPRADSGDHPTEKPIELLSTILGAVTTEGDTILDPFLGSGSTAVASKLHGCHFLGFEISGEYCDIARDRIAAAEAQPDLFEPQPMQVEFSLATES